MHKYILNCSVHGYDKIEIDDVESINNIYESLVVIVATSDCDEELQKYYKATDTILKNQNRVILIGVEDDNSTFKTLASLLVTYKSYDIYTVNEADKVSGPYLIRIEEREPDITEVQNFIGGDVTNFSDLTTILFGIQSLVDDGNIDELRAFIEDHIISIENLTTTINGMKKKCDMFNSGELFDKIRELQADKEKLQQEAEAQLNKLDEVKHERDELTVKLKNLNKEHVRLKQEKEALEGKDEYNSALTSYKAINTQLINCKTQLIIYFKEVSYVPYANTLIVQLLAKLELMKLESKLVIFDTQTKLYNTYKPLQIVTGKNYVTEKDLLINKSKSFVVAEPNQSVLVDVLTSSKNFDVVIVYDRMKEPEDLVTGNNVTKFYIINSRKDYEEVKNVLGIKDTGSIITNGHSSIPVDQRQESQYLDIPYISGFSTSTPSSKTSKYMKLMAENSKVNLMNRILEKAKVNKLFPDKFKV